MGPVAGDAFICAGDASIPAQPRLHRATVCTLGLKQRRYRILRPSCRLGLAPKGLDKRHEANERSRSGMILKTLLSGLKYSDLALI